MRGVKLVRQKRELFGYVFVYDNFLLSGFYRRRKGQRDRKTRMGGVLEIFPRFCERSGRMALTPPEGESQMLATGRALTANLRLLMPDELLLSLAPLIVCEVLKVISSLRSHAISRLLSL